MENISSTYYYFNLHFSFVVYIKHPQLDENNSFKTNLLTKDGVLLEWSVSFVIENGIDEIIMSCFLIWWMVINYLIVHRIMCVKRLLFIKPADKKYILKMY